MTESRQDHASLQAKTDEARHQAGALQSRVQELADKLKATQGGADLANATTEDLRSQLTKTQVALAELQVRFEEASAVRGRLEAKQDASAGTQQALRAATEKIQSLQGELTAADARERALRARLAPAEPTLTQAGGR